MADAPFDMFAPEILVPPAGTEVHADLEFGGHERQRLDVYLPPGIKRPARTIVWVHGGGWCTRDKRAVRFPYWLDHGFAVASIGYRMSQDALFPAQIQDVNAGLTYLHDHAGELGLDPNFVIGGASAGGHLVAMLAFTREKKEFGGDPRVNVLGVMDFYGPMDFLSMCFKMKDGEDHDTPETPEAKLIGHAIRERPDLAHAASPMTYFHGKVPPFLIAHGYDDNVVPFGQSVLLDGHLRLAGVPTKLVKIEGAGHGGPGFQAPWVHKEILDFLETRFVTVGK